MQEEDCEDQKISLRGFARLQIIDKTGNIRGDTDWCKNAIQMDKGWLNFIGGSLSPGTACPVDHMGIYTYPAASTINSTSFSAAQTANNLPVGAATRVSQGSVANGILGSLTKTVVTQVGGIIVRYTGQFAAGYLNTGAGTPINMLAVLNTTTVTASRYNPIAAIKFNSSTLDSDQIIRATYEFRFSQ